MSLRSQLVDLGHHIFRYYEERLYPLSSQSLAHRIYKCHKCGGIFSISSVLNHINYKKSNKRWASYEEIPCKDFLIKDIIE